MTVAPIRERPAQVPVFPVDVLPAGLQRYVTQASGAVAWGYAKPAILARFAPTLTFEAMHEIAEFVSER